MAVIVEASALQPWSVLKAFAGGVARGEDTAFEWDPPDAPKSCTSWTLNSSSPGSIIHSSCWLNGEPQSPMLPSCTPESSSSICCFDGQLTLLSGSAVCMSMFGGQSSPNDNK